MVQRKSADPVVVCVDDDPQVLTAVRRLLRRERIELLTTDKPETALRWLGENRVRLLITDLRMPDVDGRDLIKIVEERYPETASLILTGHPSQAPDLKSRLIAKPWDDAELKRVIRELVGPVLRDRGALRIRTSLRGDRGRLRIVGADDALRAQVSEAVSPRDFEVYWEDTHPAVDVVLVNADGVDGPLQLDDSGATVVILAERPGSAAIQAWYESGVGQVVRRPVATDALEAILRKCVLIARAKREEARREKETLRKRARRWIAARVLARSHRPSVGRHALMAGMTAAALLIGVLLAASWSALGAVAPLGGIVGDSGVDRLWRLSLQDLAERRWYQQQRLELDRQLNDETRRHYEVQQRRELPFIRPVYPSTERP